MSITPQNANSRFPIIPEGNRQCVWMELGVVSYKICDRDFNCETCPLDIGLRGSEEGAAMATEKAALSDNGFIHPLRIALMSRMVQPSRWANRYFHPLHMWLQVLDRNRVRVGFDLIAASILGSIEKLLLPEVGLELQNDAPCGEIVTQHQQFTISSPLQGKVTAVNESLKSWPNRLILEPLDEGWLFELEATSLRDDLLRCRRGDAVWPWYMNEIIKLDQHLAFHLPMESRQTLHVFIGENSASDKLRNSVPPEEYARLVREVIGGAEMRDEKLRRE
jgi:glycine cleavage system H protein